VVPTLDALPVKITASAPVVMVYLLAVPEVVTAALALVAAPRKLMPPAATASVDRVMVQSAVPAAFKILNFPLAPMSAATAEAMPVRVPDA
jgi:hypothetical protein